MLKVLSESQPDFQAQRVVGYSMELGEDDYQVFAEGLLHGSLFGAAWGESELLATLATRLRHDETMEVLAIPVTSLQSVMGFRGHDFLWRCELLHILRSRWSHHLSFGPWMAQRGDPEAWARACVILTLHVEVMQEFLRSHSSSIRWLMLLDGAHNGAHIKVGDQVLHTDAEIWSPGVLAIEPLPSSNSGFALGSSSNTVTIAVLLNDAMLPGEAGALEEKLTLVKRVFLFRRSW
eukprot:g4586.t1